MYDPTFYCFHELLEPLYPPVTRTEYNYLVHTEDLDGQFCPLPRQEKF
jgi:hypothetical protein